jgi:hypothetical protein
MMHNVSFRLRLGNTPTFIGAGVWLGYYWSSGEWLSHKDFGGTTACSGVLDSTVSATPHCCTEHHLCQFPGSLGTLHIIE